MTDPGPAGCRQAADHPNDVLSLGMASSPRFPKKSFWIGLPVVLFFVGLCWVGVWHAFNRITTEQAVYQDGIVVTGEVVKKSRYSPVKTGEQTHYITYAFQTPEGSTFSKEIRVEPRFWEGLEEDGPIQVRYVPEHPSQNLPDSWHMKTFFFLVGGISLAGALLFSTVLAGMLIGKTGGGYR